MATILALETATRMCSVALLRDGVATHYRELNDGYSHAEKLTVFVEQVLAEAGITARELDAVAVSKGPGSYTGLRIGTSTAKGICYALNIPLIAIDTLHAMCFLPELAAPKNAWKCPMIDARRMEVYTALFSADGEPQAATEAKIIDAQSFESELAVNQLVFFGDGANKCEEVLGAHPNAHIVRDAFPSARAFGPLAEAAFAAKRFEDVAYYEPYYLKDFVAGKPKKLV